MATERFDLCVVGGGITGAGVALEAAARGLKVALIEGGDLASGTSSRSTKLIHGGLRYLTHGEVGLCREATRERAALAALCPHLVRPLPILYPVMKGGRSPLTVGGGLAAYNLIGGKRRFPVAARVGPEQIEIFAPSLRAERLRAAWSFWEASTDDARLVITVIREAHLRGAVVANHVRALGFESIGGRLAAVVAVDEASGSAVTIRARAFVNATGVWASEVAGVGEAPSLRPSKGVHVVFPAALLPLQGACVVRAADGREIVAVRRGSVVVVGTTDTGFEGELREPAIEPIDVGYLLGAITDAFDVDLHPEDALGGWAGLRPLVSGHARRTVDLSRRHQLSISRSGLVTITGGKLTTFRCMALHAANAVCQQLGECRRARPHEIPLGCPEPLERVLRRAADAAERLGFGPDVASRLVWAHGDLAPALFEIIREDPALAEPLVPGLGPLAVEAVWAVRGEMAITVADVLDRRLRLALYDRLAGLGSTAPERVAAEAGWSSDRLARELAAYRWAVRRERGPLANINGADRVLGPSTIGSIS